MKRVCVGVYARTREEAEGLFGVYVIDDDDEYVCVSLSYLIREGKRRANVGIAWALPLSFV
jgi:hypothetical protein